MRPIPSSVFISGFEFSDLRAFGLGALTAFPGSPAFAACRLIVASGAGLPAGSLALRQAVGRLDWRITGIRRWRGRQLPK